MEIYKKNTQYYNIVVTERDKSLSVCVCVCFNPPPDVGHAQGSELEYEGVERKSHL